MTKLIKKLLAVFMGLTASVGVAVGLNSGKAESVKAAANKITTISGITSGSEYYIGATTGGNDFYLSVVDSSTSSSIAGTAVTDKSSANKFTFAGKDSSWSIKCSSGYYLCLKDGKDNGKLQIVTSETKFTITETDKSLLNIALGSYAIQKNNSGAQFGSYGNTQTNVWLEAASSGTTDPVAVTSITVSPTTKEMGVGDKITLQTTIEPSDATDKSVTWSTNKASVATVEDGVVTAVGIGNATITATTTDGGKTATCAITVKAATKYYLAEEVGQIADGAKAVFVTAKNYSGSYYAMGTYVSGNNIPKVDVVGDGSTISLNDNLGVYTVEVNEDSNFSFVDKNGKYIYAAGGSTGSNNHLKADTKANAGDNGVWSISILDGEATITATGDAARNLLQYNASSKIFSCYGSVQAPVSIYLDKLATVEDSVSVDSTATVDVGNSVNISATKTGKDIVWSTTAGTGSVELSNKSNTGVTIKGLTAGTATVTATVGSKSASCEVTINAVTTEKFNKVSSITAGKYLIVSDNVAMNTTLDSSKRSQYDAVTVSNNAIEWSKNENIWDVQSTKNGWTFRNVATGKFVGGTGTAKQMAFYDTLCDNIYWTISGTTGEFVIKAKINTAKSVNDTLRRNGTYGFAPYSASTGTAINLFKLNQTSTELAADFVNQYLYIGDTNYEGAGTGLCVSDSTYETAKQGLLGYGLDIIEEFKSNSDFDAAQARYEAWALANGDAAPYSQASSSSRAFLVNVNNDSMSLVIIVSVGLMVTAISYALLNKKKKLTK